MKRAVELVVTLAVCAMVFWLGPAMRELWREDGR